MRKLSVFSLALTLVFCIFLISINRSAASGPALSQQARKEALLRARDASFNAIQMGGYEVRNAEEEFQIRESFSDDLNMAHVRMDQHYQGVKVFQGELITHFQADGKLSNITGEYYKDINISITPRIGVGDAITTAARDFARTPSAEPQAELMILPKDGKYHLAYRVELIDIESNNPAAQVYFISAKNGKILFQYDNLETASATGTGNSLYSGTVSISTNSITGGFEMRDLTHGSAFTTDMRNRQSGNGTIFTDSDNIWGNSTNSDRATAGVDAHYGGALTFDYYKNTHGRNGIRNNGTGAFSRVHYGRNYNNAFWSDSCFCMTYGDGDGATFTALVAIDVAGHEMSHGVTSNTARLVYSGQSGGLNEATSDIFGTAVEFFANNANDPGDYLIGEEISVRRLANGDPDPNGGKYLRNMIHPKYDGRSIDHLSLYVSGMDVHHSSGLPNNFFYLLSEGGTNDTSRLSVTGIGRAKAEKIWYRALTVYMTSGTTFAQARSATLNAARDLYGAGSVEQNTVASAWTACGVN